MKINFSMLRCFRSSISERSARVSLFLFFGLLSLSVTFFVLADDTVTNKNIFQDSDQDGLSNDEEALYKTDPLNKDTDGDGYSDGVEVESGYDPLKKSPGDKLITESAQGATTTISTVTSSSAANLTTQVSSEIANMVQSGTTGDKEVTLQTINESVQNVLSQTDQEIVLPEVDVSDIKIKKVSKKLKGERRLEQEKEDALQYLTVMAYILVNNSPKKFHSENDLSAMMTSLGIDSLSAMTTGNTAYLEDLAEKGQKTLDEIKNVEVPEAMVDVHIKAIKMAKYSMTLKDEMKTTGGQEDPIGQIASFSKIQGFLGVVSDFSQEVSGKMKDYNITEIPIDL